jgi:hypothetical protein
MLSFVIRIGFVCLLFVASGANAQTYGNKLRGITEAKILIEELVASDKACGVTEDGIKSAIMLPISSSDFIIVENSSTIIYVIVTILSMPNSNDCVASYYIFLYTYQDITLKETGHKFSATILLWNSGGVLNYNKSDFNKAVTDNLESIVKVLITDWNLDNK